VEGGSDSNCSGAAGFSATEARSGDGCPEPDEAESGADDFWLEGSGMAITSLTVV